MAPKKADVKTVWPKIIAKAWSDPAFKKRLMQNPNEVIESYGLEIPKGKKIVIMEDTKELHHVTLPEKPTGALKEEQLEKVAAGHVCAGSDACYLTS